MHFLREKNCVNNYILFCFVLRVHVLKGNAPHVEVSMLVGSHMTAGIPLAAGSHHRGFSDPFFLENKTKSISAKTA